MCQVKAPQSGGNLTIPKHLMTFKNTIKQINSDDLDTGSLQDKALKDNCNLYQPGVLPKCGSRRHCALATSVVEIMCIWKTVEGLSSSP